MPDIQNEKKLKSKRVELTKIQAEIVSEQKELDKYKYALGNLDLKVIAAEINNEKNKEG